MFEPCVEKKIVDFGIPMDNPTVQMALLACLLEQRGHLPIVFDDGETLVQISVPGSLETARQAIELGKIARQDMKARQGIMQLLNGKITNQYVKTAERTTYLMGLTGFPDSRERTTGKIALRPPDLSGIILKPGISGDGRQEMGKTIPHLQQTLLFFEMPCDDGEILDNGCW